MIFFLNESSFMLCFMIDFYKEEEGNITGKL